MFDRHENLLLKHGKIESFLNEWPEIATIIWGESVEPPKYIEKT